MNHEPSYFSRKRLIWFWLILIFYRYHDREDHWITSHDRRNSIRETFWVTMGSGLANRIKNGSNDFYKNLYCCVFVYEIISGHDHMSEKLRLMGQFGVCASQVNYLKTFLTIFTNFCIFPFSRSRRPMVYAPCTFY